MSVLLRPHGVAAARFGWLPLLAGVAVARACAEVPGVRAALKWPNDLLVRRASADEGWGKCGGILTEAVDSDAVIVGIGVNVSQRESQLPPVADPHAYPPTSLARAGARRGRERLAVDVLRGLAHWYGRWRTAGGDPEASGVRGAYLEHCMTLGRAVTATLPGGTSLRGTATQIDQDGRLVVVTPTGEQRLAAGDVYHLRAANLVDDPPVQPRVPVAPAD
jgi:BirA family biotin operon repressor/biotin-[acetyl-CoA-carboxylase] ligase